MTFSVEHLLSGLELDSTSGRITGTAPVVGSYKLTLHAKNALGEGTRELMLKVGKMIGLTSPLGWNS